VKQTLQLKLSQHLALTPQLQQSIRLLQLSTLELNQEIEQALQENPLLEREGEDFATYAASGDAMAAPQAAAEPAGERAAETTAAERPDIDEAWGEGQDWGASAHSPRDDDDDVDAGEIQAAATSLRDHLLAQLSLTQLAGQEDRKSTRLNSSHNSESRMPSSA
jgi:RNA polymerase sigma-54 factor